MSVSHRNTRGAVSHLNTRGAKFSSIKVVTLFSYAIRVHETAACSPLSKKKMVMQFVCVQRAPLTRHYPVVVAEIVVGSLTVFFRLIHHRSPSFGTLRLTSSGGLGVGPRGWCSRHRCLVKVLKGTR